SDLTTDFIERQELLNHWSRLARLAEHDVPDEKHGALLCTGEFTSSGQRQDVACSSRLGETRFRPKLSRGHQTDSACVPRTSVATASARSRASIGFDRCASKPASSAFARSLSCACAVRAAAGSWRPWLRRARISV